MRTRRTKSRGTWFAWAALLACVLALPAAARAAPPPVAAAFERFWQAAQGRAFAQQLALWDGLVEAPYGDLYAMVVWERREHPDWEARKRRLLQARFAAYPSIAARIPAAARTLQAVLAAQVPRLRALFPDADPQPPVELVLAPGFDAKSGVRADGTPVLAFAVDSLLLERAPLDILVPHELFHLYHAQHAGIRNDGVMPGARLALPLFEEGLATYVSGQLAPGHGDGELLLQDDLGRLPAARLPEVARRFLADAGKPAVDPAHPEPFRRWFNAGAARYQPDLPNRSGYWLGLQVIRDLRRSYSLAQIAAWPPRQAEARTLAVLERMRQAARAAPAARRNYRAPSRIAATGGTAAARSAGPSTAPWPSSHSSAAPAGRYGGGSRGSS
jgi:hypothetical protein